MTPRVTDFGPRLTFADVQALEQRLNVRLPEDHRAFLLANNGGKPRPAWFRYGNDQADVAEITRFFSLEEVKTHTAELQQDVGSADFIAIGLVSDAEPLVLSKTGAVLWSSNEEAFRPDEFTRIADSFDQLLKSLDYPEATKPWMMLIDNDDREGMRQWLDSGGDVQAGDDLVLAITALEHAAATGKLEMVKLLVDRGAKPRGGLRRSCPHRYAMQGGHRDVADFLAQRGMAKGYWLHYVGIAALLVVGIVLLLAPAPRNLSDNNDLLIILVCVVAFAAGAVLVYDWFRKSPGSDERDRPNA